ncbi:Fe-S cluster assembly protein SufD [Thermotomaculum hydrothermale]|uniref:Fe-S cluster assembly protein SufD n=1 Tax=Thermotomaculum hydrothermale TaxID=981385 RepID=A0A7R6PQT6_9BACT|nr:SufD family Fe-S cluster assembly protein [Thermotomaculum hydrothermale]BBB33636.1 Fe-S cluster assembly protein SufD [Thermotomaculum hydrothermale]
MTVEIKNYPTKQNEDWRYFNLKEDKVKEILSFNEFDNETYFFKNLAEKIEHKKYSKFFNEIDYQKDFFKNLILEKGKFEKVQFEEKEKSINEYFILESGKTLSRQIDITVKPNCKTVLTIFFKPLENSFLNLLFNFLVMEDAELRLNVILDGEENSLMFFRTNHKLLENAKASVFLLQLAHSTTRIETMANLEKGASFNRYQTNILNNSSFTDTLFKAFHYGKNSSSEINNLSIVQDKAKSILNGLLFIDQKAKNSKAFQSARNIILSEESYSVSYPQLEILNPDVECSHGTSMHSFEEPQIFYLKSRGIEEDEAKAMILNGYIDFFFKNMDNKIKKYFLDFCHRKIKELM